MDIVKLSKTNFKFIILLLILLSAPSLLIAKSVRIENYSERQAPIVDDKKIYLELFESLQSKLNKSMNKSKAKNSLKGVKMPVPEQVLAVQNIED